MNYYQFVSIKSEKVSGAATVIIPIVLTSQQNEDKQIYINELIFKARELRWKVSAKWQIKISFNYNACGRFKKFESIKCFNF